MNESQPPLPPSNAPAHPAPMQGWRPMSGLAVTAFVLSLVFIVISLGGIWLSQVIPIGLGVMTLTTVKAGERRGRVLALWAIIIGLVVGSCSYLGHAAMRDSIRNVGESVLAALSAKDATVEDSDKALLPWIHRGALEANADLVPTIRKRYALVEAELGAYSGAVEMGSPYLGVVPLLMAPQNLAEVGTGELPPAWSQGSVIWLRSVFDKGSVVMAIVLQDLAGGRSAMSEMMAGGEAAIVADIRFYRSQAGGGP